MTAIDGVSFEAAYVQRTTAFIDGVDLCVVSRADLIRNKSSTGRLKDLGDVEALQQGGGSASD